MLYLFIRRGHEGPCFIKALVDLNRWQGPVQRITCVFLLFSSSADISSSTPVSGMENHVMEMCQTRPLPHEPAHMAGQAAVARRDKAQVKSKTTTTRSRTRADGDDPSQPKLDFLYVLVIELLLTSVQIRSQEAATRAHAVVRGCAPKLLRPKTVATSRFQNPLDSTKTTCEYVRRILV
jgi:hypothetical protein